MVSTKFGIRIENKRLQIGIGFGIRTHFLTVVVVVRTVVVGHHLVVRSLYC